MRGTERSGRYSLSPHRNPLHDLDFVPLCVLLEKRSLSLSKQGLLPGPLESAFLWYRGIRLPAMLAAATTVSVFCTGLLVWAATGSSAVFKVSMFFPTIVLLGKSTYRQAASNTKKQKNETRSSFSSITTYEGHSHRYYDLDMFMYCSVVLSILLGSRRLLHGRFIPVPGEKSIVCPRQWFHDSTKPGRRLCTNTRFPAGVVT